MAVWEFALAYLAAFLLLQFVVYRYLKTGDDDEGSGSAALAGGTPPDGGRAEEPPDLPGDVDVGVLPADPPSDDGPGTVDCPTCGAVNEAVETYSHCWRCADPL